MSQATYLGIQLSCPQPPRHHRQPPHPSPPYSPVHQHNSSLSFRCNMGGVPPSSPRSPSPSESLLGSNRATPEGVAASPSSDGERHGLGEVGPRRPPSPRPAHPPLNPRAKSRRMTSWSFPSPTRRRASRCRGGTPNRAATRAQVWSLLSTCGLCQLWQSRGVLPSCRFFLGCGWMSWTQHRVSRLSRLHVFARDAAQMWSGGLRLHERWQQRGTRVTQVGGIFPACLPLPFLIAGEGGQLRPHPIQSCHQGPSLQLLRRRHQENLDRREVGPICCLSTPLGLLLAGLLVRRDRSNTPSSWQQARAIIVRRTPFPATYSRLNTDFSCFQKPFHLADRLGSTHATPVSLPVPSLAVTTLPRSTAISRIWPSNPVLVLDLDRGRRSTPRAFDEPRGGH